MKNRYVSVVLLMLFIVVANLQAQSLMGTDAIPLGGEYNVQEIVSGCDDRYNGIITSRFVAEQFWIDDDSNLRIGNDTRSLTYEATDAVGLYVSDPDIEPQQSLTIVSDTLFTEELALGINVPCKTVRIYTFARPMPLDSDTANNIALPQVTSDIDFKFNVSSLRENCPLVGDDLFFGEGIDVNFMTQADGVVLVEQYGEVEGYSRGRYFIQTTNPQIYVYEDEYRRSTITLQSKNYFQRETIYNDGCFINDTYFLPAEAIFANEGSALSEELLIDIQENAVSPKVAVSNGATIAPPDGWEIWYTGNNNEIIIEYRDEASDTNAEVRLLAGDRLVFGMNADYDPNTHSIDEMFNIYFQAVPPYSLDSLITSDVTIAGLSGIRGEVSADDRIRSLTILETGIAGRIGVMTVTPMNMSDALQTAVDDLLASISTENAIDSPPDFLVELSTGEVLNPDIASVGFYDNPAFHMAFEADGTIGETMAVGIYLPYPVPTGTYDLRDFVPRDYVLAARLTLPVPIADELFMANYESNVVGTLTIDETDGVSISGSFSFAADFSYFFKGFEGKVTPDNPPPLPDNITITGNFSNLVPPPIEN